MSAWIYIKLCAYIAYECFRHPLTNSVLGITGEGKVFVKERK